MSEYQYVAFRAVDRPIDEKNLEYMRSQSSRAEITPWSFDNEYHYGDFRGDAVKMLRRGYDIHLHYANFGIRKLLIRLPCGPPNPQALKPYVAGESLRFLKDDKGPGGSLSIEPIHDPDELEELWEIDGFLDRLVPLRAEILDGDLRPLYLAHLAVSCDSEHDLEETREAPVPAGLGSLTDAQLALAELYGIGDELIAAAAQKSPPIPATVDPAACYEQWLRGEHETIKNGWLTSLLAGPHSRVRAEIPEKYRADRGAPTWPTVQPKRTMAQLRAAAEEIARESELRAAAVAARRRKRRLAKMASDPAATLRETEKLVAERSTEGYRPIAELLSELREALSGTDRSDLAEKQAQKLKAAHPKFYLLIRELRGQGFVPK